MVSLFCVEDGCERLTTFSQALRVVATQEDCPVEEIDQAFSVTERREGLKIIVEPSVHK